MKIYFRNIFTLIILILFVISVSRISNQVRSENSDGEIITSVVHECGLCDLGAEEIIEASSDNCSCCECEEKNTDENKNTNENNSQNQDNKKKNSWLINYYKVLLPFTVSEKLSEDFCNYFNVFHEIILFQIPEIPQVHYLFKLKAPPPPSDYYGTHLLKLISVFIL